MYFDNAWPIGIRQKMITGLKYIWALFGLMVKFSSQVYPVPLACSSPFWKEIWGFVTSGIRY
mgnify:CR=1 FL=1